MDIEYKLPNLTSTLQIIGSTLGIQPPYWSYPRHHHFLFELLYCKEGEVRQQVGLDSFTLHAGEWILIRSGISHSTDNQSDCPYVYFNLHFDLDDPIIRAKLCESDYIIIEANDPKSVLLSMHRESIEKAFLYNTSPEAEESETAIGRLLIQSHTLGLVSEFARLSKDSSHQRGNHSKYANELTVFETEVAHSIEKKLRSDPHGSIAEVAASLGISRGRCTHIFTKLYGQAPRQYVSRLILNEAKHLLIHSTLTIENLAEQLGFQSASHFSRQFRRWTGMPPSAYRPRYKPSHNK